MAFQTALIFITGYIGQDVTELKKDSKGQTFCRLSVGVVNSKSYSTWYQVMVYGDLAKNLVEKERIKKGLECMVKGIPSFSSYVDKKSGQTKANFGIFADWIFIQDRVITKEQQKDLEKANQIDAAIPDAEVEGLEDAPF
jgi:single-stranded DNA-binding protein